MIGIPHQLQRTAQQLRGGAPRGYATAHSLAVDDVQGRSHVRPVGQANMHGLSGFMTCMPSKVAAHSRLRNTRGWFRSQPHFHSLRVRLSPPWRLERHPRAGLTLCSVRGVNSVRSANRKFTQ